MISRQELEKAVGRFKIMELVQTSYGKDRETFEALLDLTQSYLKGDIGEMVSKGEIMVVVSNILQQNRSRALSQVISILSGSLTGKVAHYEYCKIKGCECGGSAIIGHIDKKEDAKPELNPRQ